MNDQLESQHEPRLKTPLCPIAALFFKLGCISFGGPAASIALMDQEIVQRRGWLTRQRFMEYLASTNLIPGANAVEMALLTGLSCAGWAGFLAGGIAFILPAFAITLVLSVLYHRYGIIPQVQAIFLGINPVVLAVIATATLRLGKSALRTPPAAVLAIACLIASLLGVHEVIIILAAGGLGVLSSASQTTAVAAFLTSGLAAFSQMVNQLEQWLNDHLVQLTLFFIRVGALLFGSGMVLYAFIQRDVVMGFGWLSQQQLLDAIAVGQMTPGPVMTSATFIGYQVSGIGGALVSTIGIFLPSFLIIALIGRWIPRWRRIPRVQAFLGGVNAAVVALILSVNIQLAPSAIIDIWTATLFILGLLLLLRFKLDTLWLIGGGAICGLIHHAMLGR